MEIYDEAVFMLTKLIPVTVYDLTELDALVQEHEVHFWTNSDTKQQIVIISIGILCGIISHVYFFNQDIMV